jgi:hypothetical protein
MTASKNSQMALRSIRVAKRHIGYVKWLLESHDGMATPTTRSGSDDILDLLVATDFEDEVDALIDALVEEIGVGKAPLPKVPPLQEV